MTPVVHLDCVGGIAGDMLVAALLDAGADLDFVRDQVRRLGKPFASVVLESPVVDIGSGLVARSFLVEIGGTTEEAWLARVGGRSSHLADHDADHRHDGADDGADDHVHAHYRYDAIDALLADAPLDEGARALARRAFRGLATAEATVHGVALDDVAFHEVGAIDAVVDIVSAAACLVSLGSPTVTVGPIPVGHGFVECAHGRLPVPAPATALLLRGFDVVAGGVEGEMVTPTGAALLQAGARSDAMPTLRLAALGVGAGSRRWPDRPNVVRAFVGEMQVADASASTQPLRSHLAGQSTKMVEVVCTIDDQTPEELAWVADRLRESGAAEVVTLACVGKSGRAAVQLVALSEESAATSVIDTLFRESSTLGVRVRPVDRFALHREWSHVSLGGHDLRLKLGRSTSGAIANIAVEASDCEAAARATGRPLKEVRRLALAAYEASAARAGDNEDEPSGERAGNSSDSSGD